ncbi:hypothetical protein RKD23_007099 [Streptomyces sp. SAI-170]|uniref:DUF6336 family protein n=1 Tax=Streptomyces sp. SAI-170 TaxID=3377729 RepID=UPI003C7C273D
MQRDDEGVLSPRLRLGSVVLRGVMFGAAGAVVAAMAALAVGNHHDRMEFLAVVGGLCLVLGGGFLLFGLLFWAACRRDIRRLRDFGSVKRQFEAPTMAGPVFVRLGVLALVVAPAAFGMYDLVDGASYGSWLYSH